MKLGEIVGQTLGHYTVLESIGSGGMGQVFRAHDERLDRDVALKVLPRDALANESARRRFRREALALSRLNHPNIATIYDFDSANGIDFLAMEYVNGLTLEQKLVAGPLTEKEIVRIGAQVARALEEAHENGVVHRDLKPANIMITPKGVVKVLDFGLAGIMEAQEDVLVTKTTGMTAVGGTLPYMAPEVWRGKLGDARSDIWSFGATLYEMATGAPPFKGRTHSELSEAIVRQEPAPLAPEFSPPLRTVIGNCLAKAPEERYQSAGEIRAALEAQLSSSTVVTVMTPARRPLWLWATAAVLAFLAISLSALLLYRSRQPQQIGGELVLLLSSEGRIEAPALSPDGKMAVYVAEEAGRFDLYLNRLAGGGRVRLTNDDLRKAHPTFSPDGERIAFARLRSSAEPAEICTMPTLGGEITPLIANATYPRWSPDGTRLAYLSVKPGAPMALATSVANGSDERVLLNADDIYPFINDVAWSPDGKLIAVTRSTGGMAGEIWLVPATGGSPRRLTHDPPRIFSEGPVFTPDGRGVVHSSNRAGATNLWVVPLDGGAPYRLTNGAGPDESPAVARDGTIAFVNARWRNLLLIHDLTTGATRELARHPGYVWAPAFSPDGREIAYSNFENRAQWHIWIAPVAGGQPRRLSAESGEDEIYPRFTPDGKTVLFSNWPGRGHVWQMPREGGRPVQITAQEGVSLGDISPDGKWIAFARAEDNKVRVYVAPFGGGAARRLTNSPSTLPRWSPDGKYILFSPDRTMRGGVFVIGADGAGERRISDTGGWAVWWPDGKRIAFLAVGADGTQQVRVMPASGGESQLIGKLRWSGNNNPIDISSDGRFVATGDAEHFQDDMWLLRPQK